MSPRQNQTRQNSPSDSKTWVWIAFAVIILIGIFSSKDEAKAKPEPKGIDAFYAKFEQQKRDSDLALKRIAAGAATTSRDGGTSTSRDYQTAAVDRSKMEIAVSVKPVERNTARLSGTASLGGVSDSRQSSSASTSTYTPSSSSRYYDDNYRPSVGEHYVQGYYRKDGTNVSGHYRTNRDGSFWNNYSSKGNINPHTGKVGTKSPSTSKKYR